MIQNTKTCESEQALFSLFNGSPLAKMKKVDSLHDLAIRLQVKKQFVYLFPISLLKLQFLWECETWGNFMKKFIFFSKPLIVQI